MFATILRITNHPSPATWHEIRPCFTDAANSRWIWVDGGFKKSVVPSGACFMSSLGAMYNLSEPSWPAWRASIRTRPAKNVEVLASTSNNLGLICFFGVTSFCSARVRAERQDGLIIPAVSYKFGECV